MSPVTPKPPAGDSPKMFVAGSKPPTWHLDLLRAIKRRKIQEDEDVVEDTWEPRSSLEHLDAFRDVVMPEVDRVETLREFITRTGRFPNVFAPGEDELAVELGKRVLAFLDGGDAGDVDREVLRIRMRPRRHPEENFVLMAAAYRVRSTELGHRVRRQRRVPHQQRLADKRLAMWRENVYRGAGRDRTQAQREVIAQMEFWH